MNLSVVLYADDPAVRAAIGTRSHRDVVVVAAAGNLHDNGDPRPYPASYDGVIGVGAIGADGGRATSRRSARTSTWSRPGARC